MADIPAELLRQVRAICVGLPETVEELAWVGVRWRVRGRTFAHVIAVEDAAESVLRRLPALSGEVTVVTFRVPGAEFLALCEAGPPFHFAGWGRNVMAMQLESDTDWSEVTELLTDSYCLLAPQKLVARVGRPGDGD